MKLPTKRYVHFHGAFKEKYYDGVLEVHADSMFNLCSLLFKEIFPELLHEKMLNIMFEDSKGNMTELFDPEQTLTDDQINIHIMPNPDGAWVQVVYAIIMIIVAVGMALLLAPKVENDAQTASGSNWETPENVVGQGGILPVALGKRLIGSRVASYSIDSTLKRGKSDDILQ